MAGIQQKFQLLLKKINDQHPAWALIKNMAKTAEVLSDGQRISYATSLYSQPLVKLSPRHAFLHQFEVALRVSYEIKQNQAELEKHADVWPALQEIQRELAQQIQDELKRYSVKFCESYLKVCRSICTT